jgi:uncharacterized protein YneF (UPF0154 family)
VEKLPTRLQEQLKNMMEQVGQQSSKFKQQEQFAGAGTQSAALAIYWL